MKNEKGQRLHTLTMNVIRISDGAICVSDGTRTGWLPRSQCEDWPDEGKTGDVIATEWILEKKGFV